MEELGADLPSASQEVKVASASAVPIAALMNFIRTQSLLRIADTLKLYLSGAVWKTQSNLNLVPGRNVTFTQVETKDTSTLTLDVGANGKLGWWGSFWDTTNQIGRAHV